MIWSEHDFFLNVQMGYQMTFKNQTVNVSIKVIGQWI